MPFEARLHEKPTILCVHPSAELYGSDRTFVQSVQALRERWPDAKITVMLAAHGPLADALRPFASEVRIDDLFVLRRKEVGRIWTELPRLLRCVRQARSIMQSHDLVYINTTVLLDFILASRLCDARVLIHAHELPTGLARYAFSALLRLADATMIYISDATRRSYVGLHSRRSVTIWNGTAPKTASPPQRSGILHLLLIGRFNAWKGQPLLLDALALLTSEERALVRVRLLGSAFRGQEHFRQAIIDKIADHNLHDIVSLLDFDPAPDAHFAWADIVVVPSTRPEPFGLVAIEAMAAGRAVVASRHGGLEEIVVDGETGSLFTPADAQALADIIRCYLANRDLAEAQGRQGRERFAQHFDERVYKNRIAEAAGVLLAPRMAHLSAPATPTAAQTA